MKKMWILALAAMTASFANAQDESFKQEAGDKNLEVQFAPLGGSPVSIGGIRFRSFSSETSAIRANVFLGFSNETEILTQEDKDNDILETKEKTSSFTVAIAPGIEKHFAGTNRLSPYVGVELPISFRKSSVKTEQQVDKDIEWSKVSNGGGTDGYFAVGLNALAGVDFYFTKKMYIGTELGFGVLYKSYSKSSTKLSKGDEPDPTKNGSEFNIAPMVQGQLRLGFLF